MMFKVLIKYLLVWLRGGTVVILDYDICYITSREMKKPIKLSFIGF